MWSPDRRQFLSLAALAGLSACGFSPVYGPGGAANRLTGRIRPADPVTADEYVLVRELETRLGRAAASAPMSLAYTTSITEERMAITTDNITTRFNVIGSVEFDVVDTATGGTLTSHKVQSFTSYSATGSTVATQAARRDAHERLMVILTDLIVARLMAESDRLPA
ncbi:hypothetical protein ATO6_04570 [Oceanicola sp. 22II-s10i]|uniref:LPS assembly lipoprotein LptE n=1 Tax=Oceanicola sp. 22II-s10i TaxID=1317116 RepID=UPI000B51EE39|nr:LPS assembly lipoprotein LptE [Oceanicola sp. 22II-s10i]OWU86135.1 hypothetical protein ATO6_04570 [Oceanicola sp. 22II-s10i]